MKKLIAIIIVFFFLISQVNASPVATIGYTKLASGVLTPALSFINPTAAAVVSNALCVIGPAGVATCAANYLEGMVLGQVSGEIINQIAQESPEIAEAIITFNKIKSYTDKGASLIKDLDVDETGKINQGSMRFFGESISIGTSLGFENEDDVIVNNVDIDYNDWGDYVHKSINFKDGQGGKCQIQGIGFDNINFEPI